MTKGTKFDQGKRDWTLLPWDPLEEVVKVMEFGMRKYARDNWKYVDPLGPRYLQAAFRHIIADSKGELTDPESGLHHLAHCACCVLFIIWGDQNESKNTEVRTEAAATHPPFPTGPSIRRDRHGKTMQCSTASDKDSGKLQGLGRRFRKLFDAAGY